MSEIRDIASNFEARKIRMTHDKNGHVFVLSIHPNDTPEDIMRDPLGQRYMVALVRLDDEDKPVATKATQEGIDAVRLAGALCKDEKFQRWLAMVGIAEGTTEMDTVEGLRSYLEVSSRTELKTNAKARERLLGLRAEFVQDARAGWKRGI